jgi:putative ABC transport system permease protein
MTSAQQQALARALDAQPGTLHDFPVIVDHLDLPGVAAGVKATAYGGDPAWAGLTLVSGQLYSRPDQVDANTLFLTDTGTMVGSAYILASGSHRLTVTIAGEVFAPGVCSVAAKAFLALFVLVWPSRQDGRGRPRLCHFLSGQT